MQSRKVTLRGAEALFGSAIAYAFTAVFIKIVAPMWGDKAQVLVRWGLVFIFLIIYGYLTKQDYKITFRQFGGVFAIGLTFIIVVLLFTSGIQKTSVANALFTYFGTVIIAAFTFGTLFLKESITKLKIISICLSLLGLAFFGGQLTSNSSGLLLMVIAGIFGAMTTFLYKKFKDIKRYTVLLWQFGIGTFFAALVTFVSKDEIIREFSFKVSILTLIFSFFVLLSTGLAIYGFQHFDVNLGNAISTSEIVFGAILGYLFFKETINMNEFIGGLLIFTAAIVSSFTKVED